MNKLVEGMNKEANKTETLNGMKIKKSSQNALVDLFYAVGASRGHNEKIVGLFQKAYKADKDIAVRIALYARDVRGGMGERSLFRAMITDLAIKDFNTAKQVIHKIPEVGRWDDVLTLVGTPVEKEALDMYAEALTNGDHHAHKWAPREKSSKKALAAKLRDHIFGKATSSKEKNLNSKKYRKMLSAGTEVVEQKMSSKDWKTIEFSHVPSLASARYQKAFERNAPAQYNKYIVSLEKGDSNTKINAGAVYPYDITKAVQFGNPRVAEQQWKALPDFIGNDKSFIPLIDVSGSMTVQIGDRVSALDIAIGLGIYCAQHNKSAFKDKFLTFTKIPSWVDIGGLSLEKAVRTTRRADWGMNTDFEKALDLIADTAIENNVPQEDMPEYLIVFSDMQFDQARSGSHNEPQKLVRQKFEEQGYKVPTIVYWNLRDYGSNTPVNFDREGVAMVSGFSPSLMKSVLSANIESYTPFNVMLDAVMKDRYTWQ